MKSFSLLDCTLRDGGYYNQWNFSPELITRYLETMHRLEVDIVEIGLRQFPKDNYYGPCAYSRSSFIDFLEIPDSLKISVLLNESEIRPSHIEEDLLYLFPQHNTNERIDIVRIATRFSSLNHALAISLWLKQKGLKTAVNVMQVSLLDDYDISCLCEIATPEKLDILYVADSLGALIPTKSSDLFTTLVGNSKVPVGLHAHDNLSLAFANFLTAISCGVSYIDSTLIGMGRGPGNLRTEDVLLYSESNFQQRFDKIRILSDVINTYFNPLKRKYAWGTNHFYFLSAIEGIHPSYVQDLLKDNRFVSSEIISSLLLLSQHPNSETYNQSFLESTPKSLSIDSHSCPPFQGDKINSSEITIVGPGSSVQQNEWAIKTFIQKFKHPIFAVNTSADCLADLIDFRIACHPVKLINDIRYHYSSDTPLILPFAHMTHLFDLKSCSNSLLNYSLTVSNDSPHFSAEGCSLPSPNIFLYSICVALTSGANTINLIGFDGFPLGDSRNLEMQESILLLEKSFSNIHIRSLTQSSHPINSISIHSLI